MFHSIFFCLANLSHLLSSLKIKRALCELWRAVTNYHNNSIIEKYRHTTPRAVCYGDSRIAITHQQYIIASSTNVHGLSDRSEREQRDKRRDHKYVVLYMEVRKR